MQVGDRIKQLRLKRGLSQTQLAHLSNLPQTTVSNIETLGTDPKSHTLKQIALALHVSTDFLIGLTDETLVP